MRVARSRGASNRIAIDVIVKRAARPFPDGRDLATHGNIAMAPQLLRVTVVLGGWLGFVISLCLRVFVVATRAGGISDG